MRMCGTIMVLVGLLLVSSLTFVLPWRYDVSEQEDPGIAGDKTDDLFQRSDWVPAKRYQLKKRPPFGRFSPGSGKRR